MDDDLICEDCELDYDECECGTDPSEYDEPWDIDDHPDYDPYTGSSGPDYWQNDAGEWRCG